ncbi:hypothetical protein K439DRAFT_1622831 [Ramaria rubella]|nr:hypothetical protein K439DRAFT_1622831 [Ramaria rubella]
MNVFCSLVATTSGDVPKVDTDWPRVTRSSTVTVIVVGVRVETVTSRLAVTHGGVDALGSFTGVGALDLTFVTATLLIGGNQCHFVSLIKLLLLHILLSWFSGPLWNDGTYEHTVRVKVGYFRSVMRERLLESVKKHSSGQFWVSPLESNNKLLHRWCFELVLRLRDSTTHLGKSRTPPVVERYESGVVEEDLGTEVSFVCVDTLPTSDRPYHLRDDVVLHHHHHPLHDDDSDNLHLLHLRDDDDDDLLRHHHDPPLGSVTLVFACVVPPNHHH